MKFGLFSESGHRRNAVAADTYTQDIDEIVLADELGFDEAWIAEPNHVRPNTVTHAAMIMCKAAGLTERIRFGHAIRQLPLHHPVDLLQEANACDNHLRGRFIFGYGGTHLVTHEQMEMRGIEVGHDETRAMVHESVEFMLRCWTSPEPFDFEGRYWRGKGVHVLPRPYQQPHPPIAAACSGSADTIEMAARHGFIPLFGRGNDTADEVSRWSDTYIEAATAAGRQPSRRDFHVSHIVYVGESDAEARNDVRDALTKVVAERDPVYLARHIPPGKTIADLTFDYMADVGNYWVGSPDTVRRLLREYYERSGGFGVLLMFAALPLTSPDRIARSLRLFMEEVAPGVADLDTGDGQMPSDPDRKLAEVEAR